MEFLDRLAALAKLRIPAEQLETGTKMLEFILNVLRDGTFAHRGDPMKGIQVIGLLEARNLDFDCIIIPSMNEGIFPKRSEKDLFINQAVRKEIGLPYDKERENLYYYYFTELRNNKREVHISYVEEEKRDIRSRFIDFLLDDGVVPDEAKIRLNSIATEVPKREVKKDHDLLRSLRQQLSSRGLSPTSLKNYRECPYRFYVRYLIGIQEPENIIEEAGPVEWGSAIHNALKYFYKYDFPSGVTEEEFEPAKLKLHRRLRTALSSEVACKPKQATFLDLEMYKRRLEKFLRADIERFRDDFSIVIDRIEKQIMRELIIKDTKIKLYGYPDRIDVRNGKYYIIDYKSKVPVRKKYHIGVDFTEFQLPLYGFIISNGQFENIGGLEYYEIAKDTKLISIVKEDHVAEYLTDFQKMLLSVIKEILDTRVSFHQTANQENCRYCAYTHLCGVKNVQQA
jgi:RecB family exonuclease